MAFFEEGCEGFGLHICEYRVEEPGIRVGGNITMGIVNPYHRQLAAFGQNIDPALLCW